MDEKKKKKTKVDSNKQCPKPTGTNDSFFTNLKRNLKEKVEFYWKAILVSPPLAFRGMFSYLFVTCFFVSLSCTGYSWWTSILHIFIHVSLLPREV